jgi:hypothetical protein
VSKCLFYAVETDIKASINDLRQEHNHRDNAHIRESILNWIIPIDHSRQQNDNISKQHAGTDQWFLDSPEFQEWVKSGRQTLFCPGIPSAGKTVLTSIVVDSLMAHLGADETIGIAYFYCDFQQTHEQTAEDILASLSKQLLHGQPSLPGSVMSLYDTHVALGTRPSFGEVSTMFRSVIALYSKVFILIDAIDETSTVCRHKLLPEILDQQHKANLFVTSRFIPEVSQKFVMSTQLEICASKEDVESYVETHMKSLPCFDDWSQKLCEEIRPGVSTAVDGMYVVIKIFLI